MPIALGVCALSCSLPRAYQSPRTTPPGRLSHSLAFELGQGFFEKRQREQEPLIAPEGQNPAVYSLRVGLAERWEASGSIGSLLLASEVKWNFLRSERFDAALAPRAQYFEPLVFDGSTRPLVTLSVPAPLALNVNREVSVVGSPLIAYGASGSERGLLAGAGLDLQLRSSSRLAVQPGVTAYRRLSSGETRLQFGIAVGWGRMPFYGDVAP